jgi:hypothetical protein
MYRPASFAILVATLSCSFVSAQDSYSPQVVKLTDAPQPPVVQMEYSAAPYDAGSAAEAPAMQYEIVEPCGCSECAAAAPAAKKDDKPKPTCAKSHKVLFYANDFSYLNDSSYTGSCFGDSLKNLSVGRQGKLDIGGQLRYRYHSEFGMGRQAGTVGFQDTQNDFGLVRARLYANYKMNDRIRLFAEGIFADVAANDEYLPRPIDRNRGDFLNLFADVKFPKIFDTNVRIGRQELLLGDQRLVSPLDWANTRRTFEGVRTTSKLGEVKLDTFWTEFVPVSFDEFDEGDENRTFYGTYASMKGLKDSTIDAYWLGFRNENPSADFNLNTFGARLFGKTKRNLLYDFEGAFQFGEQNALGVNHEAYMWTAGLGYKFAKMPWTPVLWGYYDFASGDDPGNPDFNRFNQLFPLAHKYLGFMDVVARANVRAPNARLTMNPTKKLKLLLWYHYFGADQATDIIPGVALPSAQNTTSDDFGNELDFFASYQLKPRANIAVGYSHFWRGEKIIGTNDADFFYLQTTLNF